MDNELRKQLEEFQEGQLTENKEWQRDILLKKLEEDGCKDPQGLLTTFSRAMADKDDSIDFEEYYVVREYKLDDIVGNLEFYGIEKKDWWKEEEEKGERKSIWEKYFYIEEDIEEEPQTTLLEDLENLVSEFSRGKISEVDVVEVLGNISKYYIKNKPKPLDPNPFK